MCVTITVGKIALFLFTSFVLELLIFPFSFQSLITFTVARSIWYCPFLSANQILLLPAYEINYLISPGAFGSLKWMTFAHLYLVIWKQPMKLCLSESVGNILLHSHHSFLLYDGSQRNWNFIGTWFLTLNPRCQQLSLYWWNAFLRLL